MRPSPIQLMHVVYKRVAVSENLAAAQKLSGLGFDFEGVKVEAKLGTATKEGQNKDPRDFLIDLEISIDNKEGKPTPYMVDVGVVGIFNVLPSLPAERRRDLITVNGASILYGVVRELVLSLTSRFLAGPLTLPGMNFQDHVEDGPNMAVAESKESSDKRVTRPRKRNLVI